MNARQLKLIAIITMTIDHIGLYLLPTDSIVTELARAIGRMAFPLFAFFVAEGFRHTSNLKKYFLRLLLFAMFVELVLVGVTLLSGEFVIFTSNVFWVLVLGLASLWLFYQKQHLFKLVILLFMIGAEWLRIPYGAYGIALILVFGLTHRFERRLLGFIVINLLFINYPIYWLFGISESAKYPWIQWFSLFGLVPICFYNYQLGKGNKWFFYWYYPLHLGVILAISWLIQ